jgi:GNAT superfamily N-acetyltransferase
VTSDVDRRGDRVTVFRAEAEHWRLLREARLAALADAPTAYASSHEEEARYGDDRWRDMAEGAAMYVALADGAPVGLAAGLARDTDDVKGLGAMWVAPAWRGRGVASRLADAVAGWARQVNARGLCLWAPADDPRALAFYERQGFRPTGRSMPFPRKGDRSICEMSMPLD